MLDVSQYSGVTEFLLKLASPTQLYNKLPAVELFPIVNSMRTVFSYVTCL